MPSHHTYTSDYSHDPVVRVTQGDSNLLAPSYHHSSSRDSPNLAIRNYRKKIQDLEDEVRNLTISNNAFDLANQGLVETNRALQKRLAQYGLMEDMTPNRSKKNLAGLRPDLRQLQTQ